MTHENLLNLVAAVHGTVIGLSFVAIFQCGSWSSRFRTWLEDINKGIDELRREIAFELAEKLQPVFEKAGNIISEILNPDGGYCEKQVNPAGSEEYRNAISDYVEKSTGKLISWRLLYIIRKANLFWASYLSWSITAILIVEILLLIIMFSVEKGFECFFSDKFIWGTFIVTVVFVVNALLGWMFSLFYHNKGIKYKV